MHAVNNASNPDATWLRMPAIAGIRDKYAARYAAIGCSRCIRKLQAGVPHFPRGQHAGTYPANDTDLQGPPEVGTPVPL